MKFHCVCVTSAVGLDFVFFSILLPTQKDVRWEDAFFSLWPPVPIPEALELVL